MLLGVLLVFAAWLGMAWFALNQDWVEPGEFGDLFGASNALFSGLALIGIAYTIYLQHEELSHIRRERKEEKEKRKRHIEPRLKFGAKKTSSGESTHLMEITVTDEENLLRNPRLSNPEKDFISLNIGEKGVKVKANQYRIAARFPDDKTEGYFDFLYEDIDGNCYSKTFSWIPSGEKPLRVNGEVI